MFITKTPAIVQYLLPAFTWRIPTSEKALYLTFDDGPIPEVTPWVLDTLRQYGAKATFFCVGDNVRKHPEVFARILSEGHAVGNHTFHHLNGWKTPLQDYLSDIDRCAAVLSSRLFRPPYGKLTPAQLRHLKSRYEIVMWDVLSGDFSAKRSPVECLMQVKKYAGPGSVVVLHDSLKAERNLRYILPEILNFFGEKGFSFRKIGHDVVPTQSSRS